MIKRILQTAALLLSIVTTNAWCENDTTSKLSARDILNTIFVTNANATSKAGIHIDYEKSTQTGPGQYRFNNLKFKFASLPKSISVKQLTIDKFEKKLKFPNIIKLRVNGIKITQDSLPGNILAYPFLQLGVDKLIFDVDFSFVYESTTKKMKFSYNIKARDHFVFECAGGLDNLPSSMLEKFYNASKYLRPTTPKEIEKKLENTALSFMKIKFVNRGLLEKLTNTYSQPVMETFRQGFIKSAATAKDIATRKMLLVLSDFMQTKKSITISLAPKNPITFKKMILLSDNEKTKQFNLTITAEK